MQRTARSHSRFTFELTIHVFSSSLLNHFHYTIYYVTVRITVKNYRFSSKDWLSLIRCDIVSFMRFRYNFRWFLRVNIIYLSSSDNRTHAFTWNALKMIGFLFIRINLRPVFNAAIDSVVVASSFDLWFCISQNIVTFRLDWGERYVKGVARFARAKLALAGWFIDSVPFPLYSLPFTRFAHALHITQSYEIADVLVTKFSRVNSDYSMFPREQSSEFRWFTRECILLV